MGNWSGGVPTAGASLVFSGTTQTTTDNNLAASTSFASITFSGSNFRVCGNAITPAAAGSAG